MELKRSHGVAIAGAVVAIVAIGLNLWPETGEDAAPPQPTPDAAQAVPKGSVAKQAASASAPAAASKAEAPSFDVVRVNPQGDTVMAGRATPGAIVTILDGETVIGQVTADAAGEWVFVPDRPLPPSSSRLSLTSRIEGGKAVPSESIVVMVVPEPEKDIAGRPASTATGTLVLKVPRSGEGPSTVLQKPGGGTDGAAFTLAVDAVDYDNSGRVAISGHAPPGATIHLYLDGRFIGRSTARDSDGRWTVVPDILIDPGRYTLRADHVDSGGKVLARVSFPFARAALPEAPQTGPSIVVQPGNSLWRLARHRYGSGPHYTIIYEANKDRIRDPDLIYPGQIFILPATN